jgi:hypothetical protein
MAKSRIKTIWHYAFVFFSDHHEMEDFHWECDDIVYMGSIEKMSHKKASKIAQLHPNFMKYYEFAMAVLYQGKGKCSSGTECPKMALESYKTRKEAETDMPYILVWRALKR